MASGKEGDCASGYSRSLYLPQVFRNMKNAKGLIAVDIGEYED